MSSADGSFYTSLAIASQDGLEEGRQAPPFLLEQLQRHQAWSAHGPQTFADRLALLEAEVARRAQINDRPRHWASTARS